MAPSEGPASALWGAQTACGLRFFAIGYDRSAQIAKHAQQHGSTLREAALTLGFVSAGQFDTWVDARRMLAS